jgi:hypothetical protein
MSMEGLTEQQIAQQLAKPKVSKLFSQALKYGIIQLGWSGVDYLRASKDNYGWESTAICGIKSSAKSNLMLQRGYAIYQDWETVKKYTITEKEQLLEVLEIKDRIPWLGIDDIAAHFPSSMYFTDRKLYAHLKSSWETLRTKFNNLDFTVTRKNKVADFILDDISGDIICYDRRGEILSHYDYQRWFWIRDYKNPKRMIPKIIRVEEIPFPLLPESFDLCAELKTGKYLVGGEWYEGEKFFRERACLIGVPRQEFIDYWEHRLHLADRATGEFKADLEIEEQERKLKMAKREERIRKLTAPPSSEASEAGRLLSQARYAKEAKASA